MSLGISVIFPAFNEAENLRRYPAEVTPVLETLALPYEALVIDDGSTDDTLDVVGCLGAHVRSIRHPHNMGLGAALRTGFANADGDLVVTMDADLTFAPSLIPQLVERFRKGDVDAVIGSPKLAGFSSDIPLYRVMISRLSTQMYSRLLGRPLTAVSQILRLYRRQDLLALDLKSVGFDINAEILFGLIREGRRIAEIPAPLTQRLHGESHLSYGREIQRHLRLVRRMLWWRMWATVGRPRPA